MLEKAINKYFVCETRLARTMVVVSNVTTVFGLLPIWILQEQLSAAIVDILRDIRKERYYNTIIYIRHGDKLAVDRYDVDNVAKVVNIPMIQLEGNMSFYLWQSGVNGCGGNEW